VCCKSAKSWIRFTRVWTLSFQRHTTTTSSLLLVVRDYNPGLVFPIPGFGWVFYDSKIPPGLWLWSPKMCPVSCDEVVSSDHRSSYFAKFCGELMNWLLGKFLSYCIIWLMGILGPTIISCISNISTCQWSWKNFWQLDIWIFNCCLNKFNLIYIWIID